MGKCDSATRPKVAGVEMSKEEKRLVRGFRQLNKAGQRKGDGFFR